MLSHFLVADDGTLLTRARSGFGRRLSGERSGGGGLTGKEIGKQPQLKVIFYTFRSDGPTNSEMVQGSEEDVRLA
jgi:hypothetical protein